jgi:predicted alpha/beta superfamily hydrolase
MENSTENDIIQIKEETINNYHCYYSYFNLSKISKIIIWPATMHFIETVQILSTLTSKKDYIIISFEVNSWNKELSPWFQKAIFEKSEDFIGNGKETLNFVINTLIPYFENKFPQIKNIPKFIGGYSLSGLFSLWVFYSVNIFNGVAAMSPSLWFDNWDKFIENKIVNENSFIYLSLGDKEEKTKNKFMKIVGDRVRKQYDIFHNYCNVKNCFYDVNPGGHFNDIKLRISKGFSWIINNT